MTEYVRVPRAWLEAFHRDTDPNEPIADNGGTVWDMFCHEAAAMLAASPQGGGSSADADTHRAAEGAAVARERDEAVRLLRRIVETKAEDYDERLEAGYIQAFLVSLSRPATTPAEPDWITHDGGPNPVPGKMVDWRNREGREETCGSDELAGWEHPHESGARYDIIAYRVTEGVK